MGTISLTLPADGQTIDAADVNTPFNTIATVINGGLDSANITDGGITPNELASGAGSSWAWQSWTPTLTNLTLGNGSVTASYIQTGKTVFFKFKFVLGTTSAVGTSPTITLPVTATSTGMSGNSIIGDVSFLDNGAAQYRGSFYYLSTTTGIIAANVASTTYLSIASVTSAAPFTFGSTDEICISGTYEAA